MTFLDALRTPALLLDESRMQRNIDAMHARAQRHGARLRPHFKTCRSIPIIERMTAGQFGGVAASTVAEVEALVAAGFRDVLYAVGLAPSKLPALLDAQREGATIRLLCDSVAVAEEVARQASSAGQALDVMIEIDCGYGRAGMAPDSAEVAEVARILHDRAGTRFGGLLTHAGHSYDCRGVAEIQQVARQERDALLAARKRLLDAGLSRPQTSAGSTPTCVWATDWTGIDEIRPGNFVFFDLAQARIGSCAIDDIAVSVLATVIGHSPARNGATIDAGSLALSPDSSVIDAWGYGLVTDLQLRPVEGVYVEKVSQEHGWLSCHGDHAGAGRRFPYETLPIGSKVRVLPAHSCITAAQYDAYTVISGPTGWARWRRVRGW